MQTKNSTENVFDSVNAALDATSATTFPGEGEQCINKSDLILSVERNKKDAFLNKSVITRRGMSLKFDNDTLFNVTDSNMELQVSIFIVNTFKHIRIMSQQRN